MADTSICRTVLDEIFEEEFGKNYGQCVEDNTGCYIDRNGTWLSTQAAARVVEEALQEVGVVIDDE